MENCIYYQQMGSILIGTLGSLINLFYKIKYYHSKFENVNFVITLPLNYYMDWGLTRIIVKLSQGCSFLGDTQTHSRPCMYFVFLSTYIPVIMFN